MLKVSEVRSFLDDGMECFLRQFQYPFSNFHAGIVLKNQARRYLIFEGIVCVFSKNAIANPILPYASLLFPHEISWLYL